MSDGVARVVVGAMSGTSADGVDAAAVRITGRGAGMSATLLAHYHHPYAPDLRQAIFRVRQAQDGVRLAELARLARQVALAYAEACRGAMSAAGTAPADLAAVAAHGQTLYHDPPNTLQWLDPALLAAEVGCPVVSDFRRADCAAGGQGAPLVPFADYVLFRDPAKTRVLLNLGGIANITHLPAGGSLAQVVAFDTGPGNCVSDALVRAVDPSGPGVDVGGRIAAQGVPVHAMIRHMLADPFFAKPPPKSTDVPAMVGLFHAARAAAGRNYPFEYLLRTACLLTATTVADAVRRFCDPFPDELIVSGGGVHNATLMDLIRQPLGSIPVLRSDDFGIPSEAKEAVAFALLGAATLDNEPSNVPAATGATRPVVLGSVTPRGRQERDG
jgi:anhydro-N-acetylmuramic acid kinase